MSRLSFYSWFWSYRSLQASVVLHIRKIWFRARNVTRDTNLSIDIYWQLFKSVLLSVVGATVALVALLFLSKPFGQVGSESRASYDSLLLGIAGVAGVFLGFYFTSLNTVAGSLYAKMPERIRELLLEERVNNLSASFVVFLTVLSASLLGVGVLAGYRPRGALLVVLVLGILAIPVFLQLSKRVFFFFDPTSLSDRLFEELQRWNTQATISGYMWHDPAFQDYYRRKAQSALDGVLVLMSTARQQENLKEEPLARLLRKAGVFVAGYIQARRTIPTASRWYPLVAEHKRWYLADDSAVRIASATSTDLEPEWKADSRWLEDALFNAALDTVRLSSPDQVHTVWPAALDSLDYSLRSLGNEWIVKGSIELLHKTYDAAVAAPPEHTHVATIHTTTDQRLGRLDYASLLPISLMLSFVESVRQLDFPALKSKLAELDWGKPESIYTLGLPLTVLERLEFTQKSLAFEKNAEGHIISPTWYITELAVQSLALTLGEQVNALVELVERYYLANSKELVKAARTSEAVVVISRGLEFFAKWRRGIAMAQALSVKLDTSHITADLPWTEWGWAQAHERMQTSWFALLDCLAQCIPGLSRWDPGVRMPDYFGKAVHTVGEECFSALLENRPALLKRIYRHFFIGAITMFGKLQTSTSGWQHAEAAFTAPILDLIDLSGYAKICAELHDAQALWDVVKARWDRYLAGPTRRERLQWLAAIVAYNRRLFAITPRSIIRTDWKLRVDELIRNLPRRDPSRPARIRSLAFADETVVDHSSLLIRLMGGHSPDYPSMYDGVAVFVDLYLSKFTEAEGLDFGKRDGLDEALERFQQAEGEQ